MSRRRAIALGVALSLGLTGCSGRSPSMLDTHGSESRRVAGIWWLMFALAAAVYLVVGAFIVLAILRGRRAEGAGKGRTPKDDTFIWLGGIVAPVAILAVLAVVTITTTRAVRAVSADELQVKVAAKRWWWGVTYPASGVTTANEIRIPVGRTVDVDLTSDNVIHSFWVPQLAGKMDTVPGQVSHLRLRATTPGTYRGECAEYCGIEHARMNFLVIAEPQADFDRWLLRRSSGAGILPDSEESARGQLVFNRQSCAGCHTIRGTQATGTTGPDLSDFGSRQWIGSVTVPNTRENLARWITDSQSIKPGNLMPPVAMSPEDVAAVVTYLEGLK